MPFPTSRFINVCLLIAAVALVVYIARTGSLLTHFSRPENKQVVLQESEPALQKLGIIRDARLTEISGIDASIRYPGCYWVHNDSGNAAELYLISSDGRVRGTVVLVGAQNIDWEDICVFETKDVPYICIGDVGDNRAVRDQYQLYLLVEPELRWENTDVESEIRLELHEFTRLPFTYVDGSMNCEGVCFDRTSHGILLFQKALDRQLRQPCAVYQLQFRSNMKQLRNRVAQRVAEWPESLTTAAATSADGTMLVTCNYVFATVLTRPRALSWAQRLNGEHGTRIPLPAQRQGEAICFSRDGKSLIVTSEFVNQPIWRLDLLHWLQSNVGSDN